MKILITGASGLLGSHLIKTGLERGHSLKLVSREFPARSWIGSMNQTNLIESGDTHSRAQKVELVTLDLLAPELPDSLFDEVSVVIHAAGLASANPEDRGRMRDLNELASIRLFEAACRHQVESWVQVSTTAVLTGGDASLGLNEGVHAHESRRLRDEDDFGRLRPTAYAETKYAFDVYLQAEREKWVHQAQKLGSEPAAIRILSIHPGYLLGAWDAKPSSGSVLFALRMGMIRHYLNGLKNFVAAHDVAEGIWQALDARAEGRFILGGLNISNHEFLRLAQAELGLRVDLKEIDLAALDTLPSRESSLIREFCASAAVSSQKAEAAFSYRPTQHVESALRATMDYFVRFKMLKRVPPA